MAEIRYEQASRMCDGAEIPAVDSLDLDLNDGELMVLVGSSGSGKSTALRMLAGLEEVDGGAIYIDGKDVTDLPPEARDVAMVFQNYAIYPYRDVAANMAFPLKVARVPKAERTRRVEEAAEMLGLTPLLGRKPAELSGGERQRAAMGRAIVRQPRAFLMDEPLSNLDAKLRVQMRGDIAALQSRLGVTTLYVTHDQVEAMTMGHRVAVLSHGKLQQCDTPRVLYDRPVNTFVAGFIGSPAMNLVSAARAAATPGLRRRMNERTVLEAIRADSPVSRAEISRRVGISKPTVSVALQSLLDSGLVRETQQRTDDGPSYGATFFEPVPEAALVLGLDLGARFLRAAVCDLSGEVRARQDIEAAGADVPELLDAAGELKRTLLDASELSPDA